MNNPLVSIIIPTFNRVHLIRETLDSVVAQTYTNWECIIVDDGSTDSTEEVVNTYVKNDERFHFKKRPIDSVKGANSCRNFGAKVAQGQYLIFLDSDDYLQDFCLAQRLNRISDLEDFTFAVFPMALKYPDGKLMNKVIPDNLNYLDEFLSNNLHWGIMCPLWKKTYFIALNGFNENYPRLNDPDLHIRAMIYYPNNYFVYNKATPDSLYNISANYSTQLFCEKVFLSLKLFIPDIVSHLKQTNNYHKVPLLKGFLRMWLKRFLVNSSYKRNIQVIKIFHDKMVISFVKSILVKVSIFLYFSIIKFSELFRKQILQKLV